MTRRKRQAYDFGVVAEYIAALYLILKGYRILALRRKSAFGEIDLVAFKKRTLVIVEVKARKTIGHCAESITPQKQERLARAAQAIAGGQTPIAGLALSRINAIRFDVVWVAPRSWPVHIKDAWRL